MNEKISFLINRYRLVVKEGEDLLEKYAALESAALEILMKRDKYNLFCL